MLQYINEIYNKKVSGGDIPQIIKIAKEELTFPNCINKCISSNTFPHEFKIPDIISVYKKQNVLITLIVYQTITLLPIILKIF